MQPKSGKFTFLHSLFPLNSCHFSSFSTMANQTPERVISFRVTPIFKLEQSVASLSDDEFNPSSMARVDITDKGFDITARNPQTGVSGSLFLKSSGLTNFYCTKPVVGKLINVVELYIVLLNGTGEDDDFVAISCADGSDHLTLSFGCDPDTQYDIGLFDMEVVIETIPRVTLFCEAVFTSEILREMIQHLQETGTSQLISVNVEERIVSTLIGLMPWIIKYDDEKFYGTRGMAPGQMHHAWFDLSHLQVMKKASFVEPCVLVCFLSEPRGHVMIRFCFRELGDLMFINQASLIIPNSQGDLAQRCRLLTNKF